jgi:hypothetical protein
MKGDANVICHFHQGLKKANPDIMPVFVLRPYWGNLLPGRNFNPFSGGDPEIPVEDLEVRPGDMCRLSAMLPEDAFICIRETDRDSYLSWKAVVKRPLYVYQASDHFWEGVRGTVGKMFPNTFRYAQAYANPLGEDAFYYCEHDASKDIADVGAAEYTWNLNAPGAGGWDVYLRDLWDKFGEQRDRNLELQAFIQRACRDLYGAAEGPLLYNTFTGLIDAKFVFDTRSFEFPSPMAVRAGIPCSKKDTVKYMQRMHEDATAAIRDLERLLEQGTERRDTEEAVVCFLAKLYPVRAGAHVLALGMAAQEAASEKERDRAQRLLTQARGTLAEEEQKLKAAWAKLAGRESLGGRVARQAPSLAKIGEELERIRVEVQSAGPEAHVKPSS